jgi:hypothetical protein
MKVALLFPGRELLRQHHFSSARFERGKMRLIKYSKSSFRKQFSCFLPFWALFAKLVDKWTFFAICHQSRVEWGSVGEIIAVKRREGAEQMATLSSKDLRRTGIFSFLLSSQTFSA